MGEVVWLSRYPVKSMLGEELRDAELTDTGLVGDRRYALIDERTGRVATAKNPPKWRGLLKIQIGYDHASGRLTMTLPDGTVIRGDHPARDELLSRALGRPVRLTDRTTPFMDYGAVHLVTTATLDALTADPRRFRPNIVLRMHEPKPFAENDWPGKTLRVGEQAALRVIVPTPRCAVPTLAQGSGLPDDGEVLRKAARLNRVPVLNLGPRTCVGAYASVHIGGTLRLGDRVMVA